MVLGEAEGLAEGSFVAVAGDGVAEFFSDDDADASYRRDAIATLVGRCLTRMAA